MCDLLIGLIVLVMLVVVISGIMSGHVMGEAVEEIKEKNIRIYRKLHKGYNFLYPDYVSAKPGTKITSRIQTVLYNNRWKISDIIGEKQKTFRILHKSLRASLIVLGILIVLTVIFCSRNN